MVLLPPLLAKQVVVTPALKINIPRMNKFLLQVAFSVVAASIFVGCTKTTSTNSQRTQPMDAIVNGTFATDAAMQEERVQQGNYIAEQERRYE